MVNFIKKFITRKLPSLFEWFYFGIFQAPSMSPSLAIHQIRMDSSSMEQWKKVII